ncbi:UNVERIFIED_CONTAM: hypothetical protein Q9R58_22150 [Methylobacteriaceae bacterium AG10]|nr:hypothetical protein [Methylobacteriaceae bacterium AG10]
MHRLALWAILVLASMPAHAQSNIETFWYQQGNGAMLQGTVLNCATGQGRAAVPCGGMASPMNVLSTSVVPTWAPVPDNVIDATNTYQVLCASARAGGTIQHQGAVGSGSIWLDVTGATGTVRSSAAMEVVARASAATGPGVYRFPPTTGAVTVYGPAGTPFQAFCG